MLEIIADLLGAQTQFLPKPGAVSFKRLLGHTERIKGILRRTSQKADGELEPLPPLFRGARDGHARKSKPPSIAETADQGIRGDPTLKGTEILVSPVGEG